MANEGRNQEVDVANLSDELLESHIPVQIADPAVGDEIYLIGYARWPMEVVDIWTKSIDGDVRFVLTVADIVVDMDPATSGADVDTDGYMLSEEGAFQQYVASGGVETDESDDEVIEVQTALKLKFMEVNDTGTAGMMFIADVLVRRLRNVP